MHMLLNGWSFQNAMLGACAQLAYFAIIDISYILNFETMQGNYSVVRLYLLSFLAVTETC